jgi:hypothetical protein
VTADVTPPPQDYGPYSLDSATPISTPQMTSKGEVDFFGPPPSSSEGRRLANGNGITGHKRARLADNFVPQKKAMTVAPPAPAPKPPVSVGVMDIGQGGCNLLIDGNGRAATYFDVGMPLWFFTSSAPPNMRLPFPVAPSGPIVSNGNPNTLNVVLSHWDWDHWRLGRAVPGLAALPWLVPNQAIGPVAFNFLLGLNAQVYQQNGPAHLSLPNYTLHKCTPPQNANPAMVQNNSGLAMEVNAVLPTVNAPNDQVLLTGDANFPSLAAPRVYPRLTGIGAVHHGSNAHGAPNNLPAPIGGAGRIAYSYGVSPNGGHPYGFPNPAAVVLYQAAQWTTQMSTGEGQNFWVAANQRHRGNILMGAQTQLAPANSYNQTAFFNFANQLV